MKNKEEMKKRSFESDDSLTRVATVEDIQKLRSSYPHV